MNLKLSNQETQPIPSELAGPLPRRVEMDSNDARYVFLIALIFIGGGAILCGWWMYTSMQQIQQRAALRSDGRVVVGEVTGLPTGRGTQYVKYSFKIKGGDFQGKARIPDGSKIILTAGDRILIRFLPSDPAVNHPDAWEWSGFTDLVPIGFQIFFALIATIGVIYLRRERTLARYGKPASGVVTSCVPNDRRFWVSYEFRTEDGRAMTGRSDRKESYETGARIWILYLSRRPRRNSLYPLPDCRIVD